MSQTQGRADVVRDWWRESLADRNSGAARGLAARLRRATPLEALSEPDVQALARRIGLGPGQAGTLVRLVQVLAEVREDDRDSLARRLGGDPPVMSHLRFQRLLRAEGEEVATALRRAIVMVDRRCNVERLAADLLAWDHPERGEAARRRWIFDYFAAPQPGGPDTAETPEETPA